MRPLSVPSVAGWKGFVNRGTTLGICHAASIPTGPAGMADRRVTTATLVAQLPGSAACRNGWLAHD